MMRGFEIEVDDEVDGMSFATLRGKERGRSQKKRGYLFVWRCTVHNGDPDVR